MKQPPIVSSQEWEAARQELLVEEKELTRARDAMAAKRRRMPWMAVERTTGSRARRAGEPGRSVRGPSPADRLPRLLRAGRDHLPAEGGGAYPERACVGCSLVADQVAHPAHLNARDTTLVFRLASPPGRDPGSEGAHGMGTHPLVHASPTTSTLTSGSTSGTGPTRSSARVIGFSAPTSSTTAATSSWAAPGATSTSPHSDVKRQWEDSPVGYPQTPPYQWWNYHDAYGKGA